MKIIAAIALCMFSFASWAQTDSSFRRRADDGPIRHVQDTIHNSAYDSLRMRKALNRQPNKARIDTAHVRPVQMRRSGTVISPGDTIRRNEIEELKPDTLHR